MRLVYGPRSAERPAVVPSAVSLSTAPQMRSDLRYRCGRKPISSHLQPLSAARQQLSTPTPRHEPQQKRRVPGNRPAQTSSVQPPPRNTLGKRVYSPKDVFQEEAEHTMAGHLPSSFHVPDPSTVRGGDSTRRTPARHKPLYICAGPPAKATGSLVNGPELMTANHTILPSGRGALTTLFSAGRRRHATCLFRAANAVLAVTIAA